MAALRHGARGDCETVRRVSRKQLVLVSYAPNFDLDREWVFNKSDTDGSKIVWARDIGPEKNRELLDYFRGREFWSVEAGGGVGPQPYREGSTEKSR